MLKLLIDNNPADIACCPWCEKPLAGHATKNEMHIACYEEFGRELNEAFPLEDMETVEPELEIELTRM